MLKQRGSAIIETLVYVGWLFPLLLLFFAVMQLIQVQTQTHKAARYVAWERTAYSGQDYQARLNDQINGFDSEVEQRFFIDEGSGFEVDEDDGVVVSSRWNDWESKRSIIDLDGGVFVREAGENNTFIDEATGFLESNSSRVNWLQDRSDVELNAIAAATLQVNLNAGNNAALTERADFTPYVDASYVLIADSWAPANETAYSDRVQGVRESVYSNAQRWYQNTQATRFFSTMFAEIDEKLFVNGSDSFEMVSPRQSTEIPGAVLEAYVEE